MYVQRTRGPVLALALSLSFAGPGERRGPGQCGLFLRPRRIMSTVCAASLYLSEPKVAVSARRISNPDEQEHDNLASSHYRACDRANARSARHDAP